MKDIEEVRKKLGVSQVKFANMIGTSYRTYQGRLSGTQEKWLLDEVIKAAELNGGEVAIPTVHGMYGFTVKKISE